MTELAYYNGDMLLGPDKSLDAMLIERGMSAERIENIRKQAYTNYCCPKLEELHCARPIIDYGTPEIKCFMMYLPNLDSMNATIYRDTVIYYCPFCGKNLTRRIHPDSQTSIEDYHE